MLAGSSVYVLTRMKKPVSRDRLLSGVSEKESASKIIHVVGRVHFLAVVELKSSFAYGLSAKNHS